MRTFGKINEKKVKRVDHSKKNSSSLPCLGDYSLKSRDDAIGAELVKLSNLINGNEVWAFNHAYIVWKYIKDHVTLKKYANKFWIIVRIAWYRNIRLIRKNNLVLSELREEQDRLAEKPEQERIQLLPITEQMLALESTLEELKQEAINYGVDLYGYLDETHDHLDVADCTNVWNQEQRKTPGEASDYVNLIRDLKGNWWILAITRQFGPGRNQRALPGGFREVGETFAQAGNREGMEETDLQFNKKVEFITNTISLDPEHSFWHDPRGKFPHGMINGAVVHEYIFVDNKKSKKKSKK